MGNCPACLSSELVHHSNEEEEEEEEEMVRVLRTTDNELFEFPGPVFVKDLLFGFQGFAVFPHKPHLPSIFRKPQQPLHPNTQLSFSQIYYLTPWIKPPFLNPLANYPTDHHQLITPLVVNQPLINPLIHTKPWVNQPFITNLGDNHLLDTADHCLLNTGHNHLNTGHNCLDTSDNCLANPGDDAPKMKGDDQLLLGEKHVVMSSAEPSINEVAGGDSIIAINAQGRALNEGLIAINTENRALIEFSGDLLSMNAQEGDLAEGLITINAADQRASNELAEGLNAQDRAFNGLAEGFILENSSFSPSSSSSFASVSDAPIQSLGKQVKVIKKVRFAEEVVLITSSNRLVNRGVVALTSSLITEGKCRSRASTKEELIPQFHKQTDNFSASKEGMMPYITKKEINGVVRVKVVISKKQLTELMSSRASDKEADALMEKMLSPLLSPTSSSHKSDTIMNGAFHSPPWRPSLDHIPEDHSFQELC